MSEHEPGTQTLHQLIDRLRAGDGAAEDELLRRIERRVERLCRSMLGRFLLVRNAEQTDDILQKSLMRLLSSVRQLRPASTRAFFGLAAEHIRRELLDLTRYYRAQRRLPPAGAPERLGSAPPSQEGVEQDPSYREPGPEELEQWQMLHEAIADLPPKQGEVVGLLFYHGWTHAEAAQLLEIDERTVRRRWMKACLSIRDRLGEMPGI